MVNFNIIEGDYPDEEEYKEFKTLYMEHLHLNMRQICEKLGINKHSAARYSKKVRQETGLQRLGNSSTLQPVRKKIKNHKHYFWNTAGFTVHKQINGKTINYGTYKNKEEAQRVVEWLKLHNWDKESLGELTL